jgi:hypothetical protein
MGFGLLIYAFYGRKHSKVRALRKSDQAVALASVRT